MSESRSRLLNLLMVFQMTGSFKMGIVSPILALLIRRQGVSIVEIGVLGMAGMLGWLIFEPLSGAIADKVNRRLMIAFASVSTAAIYVLYPLATDFTHFLILAFAMSSLSSASSVPTRALLTDLIPASGRGHTYGRYMMMVSGSSAIAPFLGGYFSETLGYALPFYAAAGVGMIGLVAIILMGPLPQTEKREQAKTKITDVLSADLINLYIVRGLYFFTFPFRSGFLPILLNESALHASETEIGTYMTLVSLTAAASQAFLGDLIDRVGGRRIIVGSISLLAVTYLGLMAVTWVPVLFLIGAVQGALQAGADTSTMIHLMSLPNKGKSGMVMGLFAEAENIGGIIANPALGYTYTAFGPLSSLILISGVLILTAGFSAVRLRPAPTVS
ncbi:TPA: MFS transporter [Candidatus Bathyarchaeota archaeon]|nr:MFS transporter [Candidatus Bathyarchaeota archaeon]